MDLNLNGNYDLASPKTQHVTVSFNAGDTPNQKYYIFFQNICTKG